MAGTILGGVLLPYGGTLFDRFGARKTMIYSCVGLGLVCLYFSFIDHLQSGGVSVFTILKPEWLAWTIIAFGFFCIRFTGQGMMAMTATAMLGKWFYYRRGVVQSLRGLFIAIGLSLTPLILNFFLQSYGWRASYWIMAGTCGFGMALVAWMFYRDNPEECGLVMDGGYRPRREKVKNEDLLIYRDFNRREALGTFTFWAFTLAFCNNSFLATGFAFHILSIGKTLGLGQYEVLSFFFPIALVSIPSNFLMGWLSDRMRIKYLLSVMTLGQVAFGLSYCFFPGLSGKMMIIAGMGVAGGAFSALSGVVWPRFYGRTHLGAISGFFMSSIVIASALSPYIFSQLYTATGTYLSAFLMVAVLGVILLACSLFADNPQRKRVEHRNG